MSEFRNMDLSIRSIENICLNNKKSYSYHILNTFIYKLQFFDNSLCYFKSLQINRAD